jgi:hypothetical protein
MTDHTDFDLTDLFDDHLSAHVKELRRGVLNTLYSNTDTISATMELADVDCQFQFLTASGANRDVELPPEATTNHPFYIHNSGASNNLIVKDDAGTVTHATLLPGQWALFISANAKGWKKISSNTSTAIEGLRVIWNSATSITVDTGSVFAENGDFIDVTSALVKSSLSLSADTWYHVYVYLNSGVPAAEVVTTAPVAWKGTAYSKTGDTSRRYVGSIKTDGGGNVYEFEHNPFDNFMLYRNVQFAASPFRVLSSGTASTATAVDVSGIVPVTGTFIYIRPTSTGDQVFYVGHNSSLSTSNWLVALQIGSSIQQQTYARIPQDASQDIYYRFNTAVGGGNAHIDVNGYWFDR